MPAMPTYAPYTWPTTNGHCSKDVNEHATRLKADFELVSRAVKGSLANTGILPSELGSGIIIGIEQGIAEACSNGYCTNWSKIEKDFLSSVIFKHIAAETALEARDRIPLPQFHGLRKSYNALHDKLVARMHPTATAQQPVATDATFKTTSAVGPVNPSNRTDTVTTSPQTPEVTITNRQEKRTEDVSGVESGDDSREDEGPVMEKSDDARDGQEMRESEDSESGSGSSEDESSDNDSSSDDSSNNDVSSDEAENQESLRVRVDSARNVIQDRSEENSAGARDSQEVREGEESESENDSGGDESGDDNSGDQDSGDGDCGDDDSSSESDASSDEAENQENLRLGEASARKTTEDRSRFWATFKLEIKHQASVNRLEGMTAPELLNCVSLSLKDFLSQQQRFSPNLFISSTGLLDNGNLQVVVRAKTREALQKFIDSAEWSQDFERALTGSPVPTYKVIVHKVEVKNFKFQNRKGKSAIIRKLADANGAMDKGNGAKPIISDFSWPKDSSKKAETSLVVEFLDSKSANQALANGLSWQKTRHPCQRAEMKGRLLRCGRCQGYGHLDKGCSAPHQCGKCAGSHPTATCQSAKFKCASCGGGHRAGSYNCPVKAKARKSLGFKLKDTCEATESAETRATPSPRVRHSISTARAQTEASIPSPVSLDANPAENEINSKSDQSLPEANPAQATPPDTPTLLKRIEDVEKVTMALKTALQSKSSSGTKRRAGEAFEDGAKAEPSNVATKRIKQEQPTRENPKGLYRQPSPFIVHRPQ